MLADIVLLKLSSLASENLLKLALVWKGGFNWHNISSQNMYLGSLHISLYKE